jgi:hypothetical protein
LHAVGSPAALTDVPMTGFGSRINEDTHDTSSFSYARLIATAVG